MSKNRIVNQGEHLSGIAAQEGFGNFHTIWDRPENADLVALREPHLLFPGDSLFIPDRQDRNESRDTDASYQFQTDLKPLWLRCKLRDMNNDPLGSVTCNLKIDGAGVPDLTSGGDGLIERKIGRTAQGAEVTVHLPTSDDPDAPPDPTWNLQVKIGSLNPAVKCSGQQARLNNMGYFAGFTVQDLEQLLWAAEEFLCDQTKAQVKARPNLAPAPKTGEDDPATSDPPTPTGVIDDDFVKKLKLAYGD
jgi:hypothetical protein